MNKSLYLFLVVSAMAAVVYISLFAWRRQSGLKVFSDTSHSVVYNMIRILPEVQHPKANRHDKTHRKKNETERGFNARKEARNDSSVIKTLSINTNVSGDKALPPETNFSIVKTLSPDTNLSRDKTRSPDTNFSRGKTLSPDTDFARGNVSVRTGSQKYLIYLCRSRATCGGWSDRQRGIVSVYLLALVTGRRFGIIMDNPCNVTHFYVPKDVGWVIPAAELKNKASIVINDLGSKSGISKILTTSGFNEYYPQDVVYIKTNSAKYHIALASNERYAQSLPEWSKSAPLPLVFAQTWKTLVRPSQYLQHRLDDYLRSISFQQRKHPLVCCHVRIGKSDTLKTDGRTRMKVSDVRVLWKFLDSYVQNGSKVFLATDNLQVRNLSHQRFGKSVSDTGGNIVHVDKARGVSDACEGFGYAVLDQLILTKCDVLVLTQSGFGRRAAFVRGENKNLFEFVGNKVKAIKLW